MDTSNRTTEQIQAGWSAYGRDGDKIGDIEEVSPNYLLVTKGLIFVTDLYIPSSAIGEVDAGEGRVYLTVDKSAVEDQGWNEAPVGDSTTAMAGTAMAGTASSRPDSEGPVEGLGYTGRESGTGDEDRLRVPLHEEQLRAERTQESAGEVRIDKNVVEEQRELDVPVTREEVEVRRVSTDRRAGADEGAFQEGDTIRIPVTAERVNVTKEPHVVEEIEISKRPVTETQRVSETVRREEVEVDETGGVLAGAGASMSGTGREFDDTTATTRSRDYEEDAPSDRDRGARAENVAEAGGAAGGALGGAAIGGAVGGPPGAVIGGVAGAAGGAILGDEAEERASDEDDDRR